MLWRARGMFSGGGVTNIEGWQDCKLAYWGEMPPGKSYNTIACLGKKNDRRFNGNVGHNVVRRGIWKINCGGHDNVRRESGGKKDYSVQDPHLGKKEWHPLGEQVPWIWGSGGRGTGQTP